MTPRGSPFPPDMFPDDVTLGEARDLLRAAVMDGEFCRCPCCGQDVFIYRRKLPSVSCRLMIAMYRRGAYARTDGGDGYMFVPPILATIGATAHQGGYALQGHHWDLLERMEGKREDGSNRVGWWRLTPRGVLFVRDQVTVRKYARLYNKRRLGNLEGDHVGIREALGHRFNYDELMAGV